MNEVVSLLTSDGAVARASLVGAPWTSSIARAPTEDVARARAEAALAEVTRRGRGVSSTLLRPRRPADGESLAEYLRWHGLLDHGFAIGELVVDYGDPRRAVPPRPYWQNILPTLAAALLLRSWIVGEGARGLVVRAAYRREGGVRRSRHATFAALDLDLVAADSHLGDRYLKAGARLAKTLDADLRLGVGSYHPPGTWWTRRLHLDAGTLGPRPGVWQIHGGSGPQPNYVEPPALELLCEHPSSRSS